MTNEEDYYEKMVREFMEGIEWKTLGAMLLGWVVGWLLCIHWFGLWPGTLVAIVGTIFVSSLMG